MTLARRSPKSLASGGCPRRSRVLLLGVATLVLLGAGEKGSVAPQPAGPTPTATVAPLSDADRTTLAGLALQWAVEGGLSDVKRLAQGSALVVASIHLPAGAVLEVPGRTVQVRSLEEIETQANEGGDFLYFRFSSFRTVGASVQVPISLLWAVGAGSAAQYLSGGGATLEFENREGTWTRLPATDPWIS